VRYFASTWFIRYSIISIIFFILNHISQKLDLFANVVRCKSLDNIPTKHKNLDILIVRQNTEGEYAKLEHENVPGVVESLKIITREKSLQIAEFAFDRAQASGRKKVTAVHKANIMKLGDGLFIACCKEVAAKYPHIKYEEMIVDNTCMQLVSKPQQFDVMVMPNLYGNIVSNLCVGLVGSNEMVGGANYGEMAALFEPGCRSSGRQTEPGKNIGNPSGFLIAAANMMKYIGYEFSYRKISKISYYLF
jgi:isocitrate dehydrogenase (NAD+)